MFSLTHTCPKSRITLLKKTYDEPEVYHYKKFLVKLARWELTWIHI